MINRCFVCFKDRKIIRIQKLNYALESNDSLFFNIILLAENPLNSVYF